MAERVKSNSFTLLEMIVAIAIFAVVMSIAGMSFVSVRKSWQSVYENGRELEALLKIDRVVDTCFRNVIPMHWRDNKTNKDRTVFMGQEDAVYMATRHRITGTDFSAIRFIKLYQEDDKLIAEYRKSPILYWDENALGLKKEVLASKIEKITFLYGDMSENDVVSWNGSWQEEKPRNFMPLAVQLKVEWKNGVTEQWLRRTSGSGQFETLGKRKKTIIESEGNTGG